MVWIKKITIVISSLVLLSCQHEVMYTHFIDIDGGGWHMDSMCVYSLPPLNEETDYDFYLIVRHTNTYPYQNMWLDIIYMNDTAAIGRDTIEFYLADNRGQWLGKKRNSLIEMPVILKSNRAFCTDIRQIFVRQLMRDTSLRGVLDIGLIIERK